MPLRYGLNALITIIIMNIIYDSKHLITTLWCSLTDGSLRAYGPPRIHVVADSILPE